MILTNHSLLQEGSLWGLAASHQPRGPFSNSISSGKMNAHCATSIDNKGRSGHPVTQRNSETMNSGRWYFWKIVVYHRQTLKYTLSNHIRFKFLTQLIKKLWSGNIGYFLAGHPLNIDLLGRDILGVGALDGGEHAVLEGGVLLLLLLVGGHVPRHAGRVAVPLQVVLLFEALPETLPSKSDTRSFLIKLYWVKYQSLKLILLVSSFASLQGLLIYLFHFCVDIM